MINTLLRLRMLLALMLASLVKTRLKNITMSKTHRENINCLEPAQNTRKRELGVNRCSFQPKGLREIENKIRYLKKYHDFRKEVIFLIISS